MHEAAPQAINWWSWQAERLPMGWFLLDFVLLVGVLAALLRGPLRRVFAERHRSIKRAVAQAAARHAQASQAHQDARHRLTTLELELRELELASARDGEAERAHTVAEAEAYATRLAKEAALEATEVLQRMQERLRRTLVRQTLADVEAALARDVTASDHERLLSENVASLAGEGER